MYKWWINILALCVLAPCVAMAQFENGSDEGAEEIEPVKAKQSVSSEDLKALEKAKQSKSEESLVRAASRILGIDANHLIALNTLGVFYFEQGKFGLARIIFNRAIQAHGEEEALHNNLGIVFLAEGKQRQALASFRKALEIKRDYRTAAANLGSIYLEYKDFERAVSPLEAGYRATRSELKSGTAYAIEVANNYAVALTGMGKFSAARDVYEEIVSSSTRNSTVLLNFAILLIEKLKDYKEGAKLLSKIKFAAEDGQVLKKVEELEDKIESEKK